jgi:type III pantothenate kinase
MILAIDAGNTRIKWGLRASGRWQSFGACPTLEVGALARNLPSLAEVPHIVVANVAGEEVRAAIERACAASGRAARYIASLGAQCGIRSSYEAPNTLGSDRWAALIGAHALYPGASLVVNAGTALTIDALTEEGLFLGGIIVPGIELMRGALDAHTAHLRHQPGEVRFFPNNTGDAIMSGAAHAACGAIERMASFMRESGQESVRVILSGGNASMLQPLLALDSLVVENLVLEGLATIAESEEC